MFIVGIVELPIGVVLTDTHKILFSGKISKMVPNLSKEYPFNWSSIVKRINLLFSV